jgi:hypothetical protein
MIYSDTREIMVEESFDSIMAISGLSRGKVALAAQKDGLPTLLEYSSKAGAAGKTLFEAGTPILNMAYGGGRLLANMGNQVIVFKENGKIALEMTFDADVLYGDISDKSEIIAVTDREALLYKIN